MGPGAFGWDDKMVLDLDVTAGAAEGCYYVSLVNTKILSPLLLPACL